MTPSQIIQFRQLVESFEDGEVGQVEFFEVATDWKVPAAAINEVLDSVRAEDGIMEEDNVGC